MNPEAIIEIAHGESEACSLFSALLAALRDRFDSDVGMIHVLATYPITGGGPIATLGFDAERMRASAHRWSAYLTELAPLGLRAINTGWIVTERDVFGSAVLAKKAFYRELILPERGVESMVGYLPWRGKATAALTLGSRGRRYSMAAREAFAKLVPALALAVAAAQSPVVTFSVTGRLTPREREVLSYVEAGLTNAEIACCVGSSVNTVRNQIASMLRKLELDSRAQLARCGLGGHEVRHA